MSIQVNHGEAFERHLDPHGAPTGVLYLLDSAVESQKGQHGNMHKTQQTLTVFSRKSLSKTHGPQREKTDCGLVSTYPEVEASKGLAFGRFLGLLSIKGSFFSTPWFQTVSTPADLSTKSTGSDLIVVLAHKDRHLTSGPLGRGPLRLSLHLHRAWDLPSPLNFETVKTCQNTQPHSIMPKKMSDWTVGLHRIAN